MASSHTQRERDENMNKYNINAFPSFNATYSRINYVLLGVTRSDWTTTNARTHSVLHTVASNFPYSRVHVLCFVFHMFVWTPRGEVQTTCNLLYSHNARHKFGYFLFVSLSNTTNISATSGHIISKQMCLRITWPRVLLLYASAFFDHHHISFFVLFALFAPHTHTQRQWNAATEQQ